MDNLLASKSLPPGFRFHPTDEELFMYYLKRKVLGKSLHPQMISELDVYRFGPWDLPSMSYLKTKDLNWYFFCPRSKKYANGGRANRSTEQGYWKSTGNDRTVKYNNRPVGKIKTLIFHMGKPPNGDRTDWVMHEHRLEDKVLADKGIAQDAYVICKVYKKSGLGPKNGENYGAPFVEDEWESDDEENVGTVSSLVPHPIPEGCGVVNNQNTSVITNTLHTTDTVVDAPTPSIDAPTPSAEQPITIAGGDQNIDATPVPLAPVETQEDELDRMLAMFSDDLPVPDGTNGVVDEDIFEDLEDIAEAFEFNSLQAGVPWSQFLAENGGGFVELNDLM